MWKHTWKIFQQASLVRIDLGDFKIWIFVLNHSETEHVNEPK